MFLLQLNASLREYGLSLNHKKTEIHELPLASIEQWTQQLNNRTVYLEKFHSYVDYNEVRAVLDLCIELMAENRENVSILYYGIRILQNHTLTHNAKSYMSKRITSLSLIYPYIVPLLDEYVYQPNETPIEEINTYTNSIYDTYIEKDYFEAVSYSLLLAVKYDVEISSFNIESIISKNDCILLLCSLIYCKHLNKAASIDSLNKHAKDLAKDGDFESFWPFTYECLEKDDLKEPWKGLKKDKVSFLKKEYRL